MPSGMARGSTTHINVLYHFMKGTPDADGGIGGRMVAGP